MVFQIKLLLPGIINNGCTVLILCKVWSDLDTLPHSLINELNRHSRVVFIKQFLKRSTTRECDLTKIEMPIAQLLLYLKNSNLRSTLIWACLCYC